MALVDSNSACIESNGDINAKEYGSHTKLLVDAHQEIVPAEGENSATVRSNLRYKIIKSILITCAFLFWGLNDTIITPSLDDLKHVLNCNYEQVTRTLVAKNVGVLIGSFSGAFFLDTFLAKQDILVAGILLVGSVAMAAIPWCTRLPLMGSMFFINGMCMGSIGCGGNAMTTALWGSAATAPLHIVHLGYAIGTILGPVLDAPFVTQSNSSANHNVSLTANNSATFLMTNSTAWLANESNASWLANHSASLSANGNSEANVKLYVDSNKIKFRLKNASSSSSSSGSIVIPFSIIAIQGLITALLFALLYFTSKRSTNENPFSNPQQKPPIRELLSPGSCAGGNTIYGLEMFTLLIFLYIMLVGKEQPIFMFIYVMAVDKELHLSPSEGELLTTMFFVSYSLGRAVVGIIGHYVPIQILMFWEFGAMLIAQIILTLFAFNSRLSLWISFLLFGFCSGPMFPSGMSWIDRYLRMNTLAYSTISIGSSSGGFIFSWFAGYLMQYHTSQDILTLSLVCGILAALIMVAMQLLGYRHGDRYAQNVTYAVHVHNDADVQVSDTENLIN